MHTTHKLTLIAGLLVTLLVAGAIASDQIPAPKQTRPIALIGATVHPVSGPAIDNATIVFNDGKIVAIGREVAMPMGAEQIDVDGLHVYPGMIAANTSMGLVEIASVRATRDYAEVGAIKPNVRAEVSINPDSELLPVSRANGITMALSVPVGGLISGTSALISLDGWTWEDLTVKAPAGMHIFWPRMTASTAWWERRSKEEQLKSRDENLQRIKDAFANARAYGKAKATGTTDTDLRWDALLPVINREVRAFIHANGINEIQASVAWAKTENLDVVIVGGADAWRVTDLLKDNQVSVIVADIHRTPSRRWEDYDAPFTLPKKLKDAGIPFCIATGGGGFGTAHIRNLPYHAATAAAYGLSKEDALRSITLSAAEVLGVDDRVGSLEVGKDATLIVTNGDPLEITTNVEMSFIEGRQIDLESRHTQLYKKYQAKYKKMKSPGQVTVGEK
jgi:imidazolonepropionase-like amidohydrolase